MLVATNFNNTVFKLAFGAGGEIFASLWHRRRESLHKGQSGKNFEISMWATLTICSEKF